ncbi:MAG: LptE family protein [Candidatus Aminicenantes bacterium]|nr:LptE family protein [Candidatus Aminicenantes bacterium]
MHAARGSAAMAVLLVAAFVAAGCGYRLRGTGSSLPPGIRTVSVPVFKNLTTRYELDVKLTRAVIDELVARGQVSVAADPAAADAVLEGEITGFTANPIGFTGAGQADRYTLTVTAKVTLKERATAKALFTNPAFIYQQEYSVPPGSSFESVQTEAIDKIAGKFARSLVVSILEGF